MRTLATQLRSLPFLLLLFMLGNADPAAATPVAKVQVAVGAPLLFPGGGDRSARLLERSELNAGDVVQTGPAGRLVLLFTDGSSVRLNERTVARILAPARTGRGSKGFLEVLAGEVWARLQPGRAIKTRSVIAGVRGTEFYLRVEPGDVTTLVVLEGEVDFFNDLGSVKVQEAQTSTARPGQAPTAPVAAANAGLIIEWTLDLARTHVPIERTWITRKRADRTALLVELEKELAQRPDHAAARVRFGEALFDSGRYREALEQWDRAVRVPATDLAVRRGYAYLKLNRLDEAEGEFARIAEQAPGRAGQAAVRLRRGRPGEAERLAREAVQLNPSAALPQVYLGLAILRQRGRQAEAVGAFREAQERADPDAYQGSAWLAAALLASGDHPAALREAEKAAEAEPESALTQANLALVRFFAGQPRRAVASARAAIDLDPDSVGARVVLAQALLSQGDLAGGAAMAETAVALDPDLPQARLVRGLAHAQGRDYRHAVRELQKALDLDPSLLSAANALARVYVRMGDPEAAIRLLSTLAAPMDQADLVLGAQAETYRATGRYREAISSYRAGIRLNPNSALLHAGLCRAAIDANRLGEAINAGRTAVGLAPQVAQYRAILGLAYRFASLHREAEREFRAAVSLDPHNGLALTRLSLGSAGIDLRTAYVGLLQALIFEPATPAELLRGGTTAEIAPTFGSDWLRRGDLLHAAPAADARYHFLTRVQGTQDNRSGDHNQRYRVDLLHATTYQPRPRTTLYAHLLGGFQREQFQDSLGIPFIGPDNTRDVRYGGFGIAARHQFPREQELTTALVGYQFRTALTSPTQLVDRPTRRLTLESDPGLSAEARYDWKFDRNAEFPLRAGVGVAVSRATLTNRFLLAGLGNPPPALAVLTDRDRVTLNTGYLEVAKRFSPRLDLFAQLRLQSETIRHRSTADPRSDPSTVTESREGELAVLPSLRLTLEIDPASTLRLTHDQQVLQQFIGSVLATVSPRVSLDPAAQPGGLLATGPDPANLFAVQQPIALFHRLSVSQLEYERFFGRATFLRAFAYYSEASNLRIGETDFTGFIPGIPSAAPMAIQIRRWRSTGGGVTFETILAKRLFASAGFVLRTSESRTPGQLFHRAAAPYEPNTLLTLGLDYLDPGGTQLGLRWRQVGAYHNDFSVVFGNPFSRRFNFERRQYLDVRLARSVNRRVELAIVLRNAFNERTLIYGRIPGEDRQVSGVLTLRL